MIFFSGKKSCPPAIGTFREESLSSDCTEETYLAPNSLKTQTDLPDETIIIPIVPEDREIRYSGDLNTGLVRYSNGESVSS